MVGYVPGLGHWPRPLGQRRDERLMRLPPLPEDQWDERTRAALAALLPPDRRNPQGVGNAMATLARHPDLTETFLPFNTRLLLHNTLPPRLRELAILRVARRCACAYEWTHHVKIAARAGLSEAEIEAAGLGKAAGDLDSAVLSAVDELGDTSNLSDRTLGRLHLRQPGPAGNAGDLPRRDGQGHSGLPVW